MITLGSEVKDIITDFKGIAVTYTVHKNGCVRVCVQPKVDKNGDMVSDRWVDVEDLVLTGQAAVTKALLRIPLTEEGDEQQPGGPGRSVPSSFRTPPSRD